MRIATYALAACAGAFLWLLVTAGAAVAADPEPPAPGVPDPTTGRRATPQASLGGTVAAAGDIVSSGRQEVSRAVAPMAPVVPPGDRVVDVVDRQVDRTTDVALGSVSHVAHAVNRTVGDVVRPVTDPPPDTPTVQPPPEPTAPAATPADRAERPERAEQARPEPVREIDRPATAHHPAARQVDGPRSKVVAAAERGATGSGGPARDLHTIPAPGASDDRAAVPADEPSPGHDAGDAVASTDGGGGGALAVLEGRAPEHAESAPARTRSPRAARPGPSFPPSFSPD